MELQLQGRTLAYEDTGHGPAVLFLHAFPLSGRMWKAQREALESRYRVLTLDFPGFGGSTPVADASLESFARDALTLLDARGILTAAVVGLSMGGYTAFPLYELAPHRVTALALCDTRAAADSDEARRGREDNARAVEASGPGILVERMLPKLLAPGASSSVRAGVEQLMLAAPVAGAAAALRAMGRRPDSTGSLPAFACPVLVLVGEHDAITPPEEARDMARAIPGAELALIPGAGHLSNLEAPEAFNAAIAGFLDSALEA